MAFPFQIRPQSSDAHNNNNNNNNNNNSIFTTNNNNRFLVQNIALAKKNSFLMSKIAGLEAKISQLIQENIDLRALNAKNEDSKRRGLEDKLNVIEEGIAQRFEDMLQMFSTIRQNEGLPSSQISMQTIMRNITGEPSTSHSEKTVSFDMMDSPKKSSKSERRRKSARRQSIYIAPPSPPPQDPSMEKQEQAGTEDTDHELHEQQEQYTQIPIKQPRPQLPAPEQHLELFALSTPQLSAPVLENNIPLHFDEPNPFEDDPEHEHSLYETSRQNLSEYLIPEEDDERDYDDEEDKGNDLSTELLLATSMSPIKFDKRSPTKLSDTKKISFQVFEDSPEPEQLQAKIQRLASEAVKTTSPQENILASSNVPKQEKKTNRKKKSINNNDNKPLKVTKSIEIMADDDDDSDEHKPLEQDISKIKHTKKITPKSKSTMDEKMPVSSSTTTTTTATTTTADSEEFANAGRSRRSRGGQQVSYAEPSLRVKMRRQSEKFVDAIVDGAFVRPTSRSSFVKEEILSEKNSSIISPVEVAVEDNVASEEVETNEPVESIKPTKATDEYIEASRDSATHEHKRPLTIQDSENVTKRRKPLSSLSKNGKVQKTNDKLFKKSVLDELSVFDLVEESSVGVPKTYKGKPDITTRRKSAERRHSSLL